MADNARLHEILDVYEEALKAGDTATAEQALALYNAESVAPVATGDAAAAAAPAAAPMNARVAAGAGVGEAALTALTGAVATPLAGLWGLANLIAGRGVDESTSAIEDLQRTLTYSPRTQAGKDSLAAVAKPFEKLQQGADFAGQAVGDFTGSPLAATAVRTVLEGAPDLLGLKGVSALRGVKPRVPSANPSVSLLRDAGVDVSRTQAGEAGLLARRASEGADTALGPDRAFLDRQGRQFNSAVLREMGFEGDKLDVQTLQTLRRQVTDRMDEFAGKYDTPFDQKLLDDLGDIEADATIVLGDTVAPVKNQISHIIDKAVTGKIDGRAAQHARQLINSMGKNPMHAEWAARLRGALDDALERGAPKDAVADITKARQQYRQLEQVEKAMANNPGDIVSPSRLYNVVDDRKNRGSGLFPVAQAGKNVIPDRTPNSGTAQRAAPVALAASMATHPVQALATVGSLGLGRYMNRNPAAFMARGPAKLAAGAGGVSGSGDAMVAEIQRRTEEMLGAIGAR